MVAHGLGGLPPDRLWRWRGLGHAFNLSRLVTEQWVVWDCPWRPIHCEAIGAGVVEDALVGACCSPACGEGSREWQAAVIGLDELEADTALPARQVCSRRGCDQRHRKGVA